MNIDEAYRIKKLETRVEALEKRGHEASIIRDGRWGAQADNAYERYPEIVDTTQGRCIVPEARVLRWEKIEKAAISLADGAWSATAIEAGLKRLLLALER